MIKSCRWRNMKYQECNPDQRSTKAGIRKNFVCLCFVHRTMLELCCCFFWWFLITNHWLVYMGRQRLVVCRPLYCALVVECNGWLWLKMEVVLDYCRPHFWVYFFPGAFSESLGLVVSSWCWSCYLVWVVSGGSSGSGGSGPHRGAEWSQAGLRK